MNNQPTLTDLERIARQAGKILYENYEQNIEVSFKGEIDLVTEVDHKSEEFVIGEIQRLFNNHQIFAEESGETSGNAEHVWYIDPLDGTVNYAHGVPMFCVSIAYCYQGQLALGAVYDPMRDEMFLGESGKGAWSNGRPLKVSMATELSRSLLATGFPYDTWYAKRNNFDYFVKLAKMTQGVRRLGSAALDLCYVAAGRFDGYWELSMKPWDIAAAGLIAREAGATVTSVDGDPDFLKPPQSILAGNALIYQQLFDQLR